MIGPENLTGVWQGLFTYPRHYSAVSFTATLIESNRWLSGSTHESCTIGTQRGETLYATLRGRGEGETVNFTKTYDGSAEHYHSVEYEGGISSDLTEIEGIWKIRGSWSGRFLMIRSGGRAIEVARKAFERA